MGFLNIAARLVRHGRRLHLRFRAAYPHLEEFQAALNRLNAPARVRLTPPDNRIRIHPTPNGDTARPEPAPATTQRPQQAARASPPAAMHTGMRTPANAHRRQTETIKESGILKNPAAKQNQGQN